MLAKAVFFVFAWVMVVPQRCSGIVCVSFPFRKGTRHLRYVASSKKLSLSSNACEGNLTSKSFPGQYLRNLKSVRHLQIRAANSATEPNVIHELVVLSVEWCQNHFSINLENRENLYKCCQWHDSTV